MEKLFKLIGCLAGCGFVVWGAVWFGSIVFAGWVIVKLLQHFGVI